LAPPNSILTPRMAQRRSGWRDDDDVQGSSADRHRQRARPWLCRAGRTSFNADKMTIEFAFSHAWRHWAYRSRFPAVHAGLDRNDLLGIIRKSPGRQGARLASWTSAWPFEAALADQGRRRRRRAARARGRCPTRGLARTRPGLPRAATPAPSSLLETGRRRPATRSPGEPVLLPGAVTACRQPSGKRCASGPGPGLTAWR
jgi:hypothetical protein